MHSPFIVWTCILAEENRESVTDLFSQNVIQDNRNPVASLFTWNKVRGQNTQNEQVRKANVYQAV